MAIIRNGIYFKVISLNCKSEMLIEGLR